MIDAVQTEGEKANYYMFWKKIKGWYEAIGLAILLFAFGWQCFEEHSNQMKMEGLLCEVHENIFAIWESVYDEALHSDRYHGKAMVTVDYDALNSHVKDWGQIKRDLTTIEDQTTTFFWIRVALYLFGSVLVILSKTAQSRR